MGGDSATIGRSLTLVHRYEAAKSPTYQRGRDSKHVDAVCPYKRLERALLFHVAMCDMCTLAAHNDMVNSHLTPSSLTKYSKNLIINGNAQLAMSSVVQACVRFAPIGAISKDRRLS